LQLGRRRPPEKVQPVTSEPEIRIVPDRDMRVGGAVDAAKGGFLRRHLPTLASVAGQIVPSVAATVLGAYIVANYVNGRPAQPAVQIQAPAGGQIAASAVPQAAVGQGEAAPADPKPKGSVLDRLPAPVQGLIEALRPDAKPVAAREEAKAPDGRNEEPKAVETKAVETKAGEAKANESKGGEFKGGESRSAEKPAEQIRVIPLTPAPKAEARKATEKPAKAPRRESKTESAKIEPAKPEGARVELGKAEPQKAESKADLTTVESAKIELPRDAASAAEPVQPKTEARLPEEPRSVGASESAEDAADAIVMARRALDRMRNEPQAVSAEAVPGAETADAAATATLAPPHSARHAQPVTSSRVVDAPYLPPGVPAQGPSARAEPAAAVPALPPPVIVAAPDGVRGTGRQQRRPAFEAIDPDRPVPPADIPGVPPPGFVIVR
jgi:hypothetical protein